MRKTRNLDGKWGKKWNIQIDAYYDAHPEIKAKLKEYFKDAGRLKANPKDTFRGLVQDKLYKGDSLKQAIKKTIRSEIFMDKEIRLHENAVKGLRGFKDAYEDWRKFTRHQKIDKSKLKYIGDNTYEYDFNNNWFVYIQYTNSPEEAKVWRKHK